MKRCALLLVAAVLAACSSAPRDEKPRPAITVYADSALTETFTKIGQDFTALKGIEVKFIFGASSALEKQLNAGAPADVYATASHLNMKHPSKVFAQSYLVLAAGKGAEGVTSMARLKEHSYAMCVEEAPCGADAKRQLINGAYVSFRDSVVPAPKVHEQDVKGVVAKIKSGEVDAGFVYETDVQANPELSVVDKHHGPEDPVTEFPIAVPSGSPHANEFYAYVFSEPARKTLTDAGFTLP